MALLLTNVGYRNARAAGPARRTWAWRSRHGASSVRGRFVLGRHRGHIGARPRGILAGRDAALLYPAGSGGHLPEPDDASGGRPIPMDKIRLRRNGGISH